MYYDHGDIMCWKCMVIEMYGYQGVYVEPGDRKKSEKIKRKKDRKKEGKKERRKKP